MYFTTTASTTTLLLAAAFSALTSASPLAHSKRGSLPPSESTTPYGINPAGFHLMAYSTTSSETWVLSASHPTNDDPYVDLRATPSADLQSYDNGTTPSTFFICSDPADTTLLNVWATDYCIDDCEDLPKYQYGNLSPVENGSLLFQQGIEPQGGLDFMGDPTTTLGIAEDQSLYPWSLCNTGADGEIQVLTYGGVADVCVPVYVLAQQIEDN